MSQKVYAKWHDIQLKNGGEKKRVKNMCKRAAKKKIKGENALTCSLMILSLSPPSHKCRFSIFVIIINISCLSASNQFFCWTLLITQKRWR